MKIGKELAELRRMTVGELQLRYAKLFGEETRARNKPWLVKRIAWRIQSQEEGGLTERARQRASELACDADVRLSPPKARVSSATNNQTTSRKLSVLRDDRLPPPGTVLNREYKDQSIQVRVLENGFECEGEVYKSLSAVSKAITGQHCNGYRFFRLTGESR